MAGQGSTKKSKRDVIAALRQPKVAVMLMLGFSSGLPFLLSGNTLGYWLREEGTTLQAIGFLSWVGLAYSVKFLWAPIIDHVDAPLFGRFGRRRGWMIVSQLLVAAGLFAMSSVGLGAGLVFVGLLAVIVAFASSTQDIVVDAWRIEAASDSDELGLLSAAYQLGYRGALLVTDSLILIFAAHVGWQVSYELMAVLMAVGATAVFMAREPAVSVRAAATAHPALFTPRGLFDAVVGPFVAFFRDHGWWALLMLTAISLYRLPDFLMGPMANPFYADLGIDKEVVGAVRGSVGLVATILGIAAAGVASLRIGAIPTLLAGAVLGPGSNLAFSYLALHGADPGVFTAAMVIDNFCNGFAGVALIGYMSSLTNVGYTATQYALLSSFYALPGKFLKGLSGVAVEHLEVGRSLLDAYSLFFVGTALIGVPALLLCLILAVRRPGAAPGAPAANGLTG